MLAGHLIKGRKESKNNYTNQLSENLKNKNEFGCKPKKLCVDMGSEFYNRSMKSWLKGTDIEIYSTHNERKSFNGKNLFKNIKEH